MTRKHLTGVAVVIVNYNGGKHIINCLAALRNQTVAPEKVIVVDNNSVDSSIYEVRSRFPDVELMELSENTGFAAANNRAFERLEGFTWAALLNPDAIPFEDWLESLLAATGENPHCDIFSSKLVDAADHGLLDGSGDVYHVCGLSWRRHHGIRVDQAGLGNDPVFSPCGAAALYRLDSVNSAGGFDESYFCYHEDVDLVFRMRLQGSECIYVDASVAAHVGSGLTGKDSDFSIYHGHRNLVWTYFKNMPGWWVFWYLPQHLLLNIVVLFYYTFVGRGRIIWKAKWDAVKGLGTALEKRKIIQRNRKVDSSDIIGSMCKGIFRPYISRSR
jgi:GT2 family glycosyltransferase